MPIKSESTKSCQPLTACLLLISSVHILVIVRGVSSDEGNRQHKLPATNLSDNGQQASTTHFYKNHRMDSNSKFLNNVTLLNHQDRQALDSILRPQLAVQIFTNPPDSQEHLNSKSQLSGGPNDVMSTVNDEIANHQLQPPSSRQYQQRRSVADISQSKSNPWHYITDQPPSSDSIGGDFTKSSLNDDNASSSDSGGFVDLRGASGSQTPTINAIITVPSASTTPSRHYHPNNQQQKALLDDPMQNNSSIPNVEHSISQLIDNQAVGNIEFSMNLNGDEIVINPISKLDRRVFNDNSSYTGSIDRNRSDGTYEGMAGRRYRSRASGGFLRQLNSISKALNKHIASDLAGDEQSASEISSISGDDGGEKEDIESDDHNSSRDRADDKYSNSRSKDYDSEKDGHVTSSNRFWINSLASDTDDEDNNDEQAMIESQSNEGRLANISHKNRDSRHDFHHEDTKKSPNKQQVSTSRTKTGKNKKQSYRGTSGSRRQVTHRAEDSAASGERGSGRIREPSRVDQGRSEDSDVPSVMIKGEDVKRIEQLLENLRSLSLNNLTTGKSKRIESKSSKSTSHNGRHKNSYASSASSQGQDHESSNSDTTIGNDCDRRKLQHQLHKSASNDESHSTFETDSSPNIVDQDPMTSNDGSDDVGDDSSQNMEQEEQQSSDNHNKLSLPNNMDSMDSDITSPNSESFYAKEKPRSLYVRKTILQSYYDNNAKQAMGLNNDNDLESIHRAEHNAQHEHFSNSRGGLNNQQQAHTTTDRARQQPSSKTKQVDEENLSPINNYIDYNQLNDREVYRGSESQKFKIAVPKREQMDRMRSLQQVIERAAIEVGRNRSIRS